MSFVLRICFLQVVGGFSCLFAQNFTDAQGRKQGLWSKVFPGTSVYQYKGQFKDDKPIGVFNYYYPSNKLKATIKHQESSNRSEGIYYHENGILMCKGIYYNLKKDSVWCTYATNGKLSMKETYKNDSLDGQKIVFYVSQDAADKSNWIFSKAQYKLGRLEGEYLEYFEGGVLKIKGFYENSLKSGLWESYDVNGTKILEEHYLKGLKNGWFKAFDQSGKEVSKQYFIEGRQIHGKELEIRLNQLKFNMHKSTH